MEFLVPMESQLGPALANFFVAFYETKLLGNPNRSLMYDRYADDRFVVFNNQRECADFFIFFNSLHPFLRFTFEKECNGSHPLLDVLVEQSKSKFITSAYRKSTIAVQYSR